MTYTDLVILIPCHSLEDFPTELPDDQATSLLNCFAVAWHPRFLAMSKTLPAWDRADEPPDTLENRLMLVPTAANDWIPGGWTDRARLEGAVVIDGLESREEIAVAALAPLLEQAPEEQNAAEENTSETTATPEIDADLVADFYALGLCWLQMELLTRHMHHFGSMDDINLEQEAVAAAQAALANDDEAAKRHLRNAFESLLEARERFYPVECYLIDLCLLIPRIAEENPAAVQELLTSGRPVNLICSGEDWDTLATSQPDLVQQAKSAWESRTIDLIGGDLREAPLPLLPLGSSLWEFQEGHRRFRQHFGQTPKVWGRRRYGLSTQLPQILSRFGQRGVLHLVMDDGLYPEEDSSRIRWEGCDGTGIDAVCRFPLSAEGSSSFLRYSQLMAESMDRDQAAAVLFARWPEIKSPWFDDFRRMQKYAPVLGKFVTLTSYFEDSDDHGHLMHFSQGEYLSPFFVQYAARQLPDPLSRITRHVQLRQKFEAAQWCAAMTRFVCGQPVDPSQWAEAESIVEHANPDAEADVATAAAQSLQAYADRSARELAEVVMSGAGSEPGFLLINSLPHTRVCTVDLPELETPPSLGGPVKAVQFDEKCQTVVVELPGSGFVWLPKSTSDGKAMSKGTPLAEENVLRNDFFEVLINPATGGIGRIKEYGRAPNRLSQQVSYRFARERTITVGDEDGPGKEESSYYAQMVCRSSEVVSSGPAVGEIVTRGEIVDQATGSLLAEYTQTMRLARFRRVLDVDLQLDISKEPDAEPWINYYTLRFAWNDSTAALTRGVQQGAHSFRGERFESTDYLEIADEDQRTTLLFQGLPCHRKTDVRLLDTLLVTKNESRRSFQFAVAIDDPYPQAAAQATSVLPLIVPTKSGPPRSGNSGWLLHINGRNVQSLLILPTLPDPDPESEFHTAKPGFAWRLLETEGRARTVQVRCFRTPTSARLRDFAGRTLAKLTVEGDHLNVSLDGHEIVELEVHFEN